jgi:rfaE bifunctional protein kinase chain/domain
MSLKARLLELIRELAARRVMVIGDFVADRYLLTEPARLSREAPVMIARYLGEETIPGGAANALNNILALGGRAVPIGVLGRDKQGDALVSAFAAREVDVGGLVQDEEYRTITKARVMVGDPGRMKQQVLRIDWEPPKEPSDRARANLLERIRSSLARVDAVIYSDYGYSLVNGAMLDAVRGAAGDRIVTADSRYHITAYRGVTLATPNEGEAEEAVGIRVRTPEDLERAGRLLLDRMGSPALLVTRGNRGMSLFERGRPRVDIPATGSDQVVDVSGAGDTVIVVATMALASGASMVEAAWLANIAAGIVVMKPGAATCAPAELRAAVERYA